MMCDIRVKKGDYFRLLRRYGLSLFAPHGEGQRFARLFRETWAQIPLWARRAILRHWRVMGFTRVELVNDWSGRQGAKGYRAGRPVRRGKGLRGDKACCTWRGHKLRFWCPIVRAYPDDLVRDLIAHELAHVVQNAFELEFYDNYETEQSADEFVEAWGFSVTAIDDWDSEHGLLRVIEWDTLSERQKRRVWTRFVRGGRLAC
jgi:hypothetical protein